MWELNRQLLDELGVGALSDEAAEALLRQMYETLDHKHFELLKQEIHDNTAAILATTENT